VAAPAHDDADGVRERFVKEPVVSRADPAVRNGKRRCSLCGRSRSKHGRRRSPRLKCNDASGALPPAGAAGQSTTATTWISTSCSGSPQLQHREVGRGRLVVVGREVGIHTALALPMSPMRGRARKMKRAPRPWATRPAFSVSMMPSIVGAPGLQGRSSRYLRICSRLCGWSWYTAAQCRRKPEDLAALDL